MHTLRKKDRDASMTNYVSFQGVPMHRGIAFTIDHIEDHGGRVDIFSACRKDAVIKEHNAQFGTHLSGQQFLYDHQNQPGFNPANPVTQTSHCGFADAVTGRIFGVRPGAELPWYGEGVDLSDRGKVEDVSNFLAVAHHLGYSFRQPYNSGSERHHVILIASPIPVLERWNVISKNRSAS